MDFDSHLACFKKEREWRGSKGAAVRKNKERAKRVKERNKKKN